VLVAGLAFAAALMVAFCLDRLVERAVIQLRSTARVRPGESSNARRSSSGLTQT
jgi:hypothetical protein